MRRDEPYHDDPSENFYQSVMELHAGLEPPFTQLVRSMLDAGMTVQEIVRLVLAESEKR